MRTVRHRLPLACAFTVAFALALAPHAAYAADPATFVSLGPLFYQSTTYYDRSGHVQTSPCTFEKTGESLYVQHDLGAGDQLRLSTEYDDVRCGGPATQGLYDVEVAYLKGIGGRARPAHFQLEGGLVIPPGYSIASNPRLGLGRPGAELGTLYNGSFKAGSLDGYVIAGVAVRGYTGYPAPQLLANVTAGLHLSRTVLAYESFYGTTHLGAGGVLTNIGLNPTVNAVYDSYTLSENVAYAFTPRTSIAVTYQTQLGGWNTGIGTTVQAGLWQRF